MPKKKQSVVDAMDEIENQIKLLCDQANNQMKVQEYGKALNRYDQRATDILGPGKEDELFQSFVRVELKEEEDEESKKKPETRLSKLAAPKTEIESPRKKQTTIIEPEKPRRGRKAKIDSEALKKRRPKDSFNEIYTDKDRAAAVSAGSFDIKQSLKIKQKQDRHSALLIPEEADPSSLIALGLKEIKNGNTKNAIMSFGKALDLNANDVNALVARSKCYLLLGEPAKALEDAETALNVDKNNIRGIYQKAEALYYLGQFEQSLMFFHCGLRARPELTMFRLGVQKTQEAIENTIGVVKKGILARPKQLKKNQNSAKQTPVETPKSTKTTARSRRTVDHEKRNARKLLGELCVDKEYLENLLKHPDLKRADTNTENVSIFAREAVDFLNKRQEFWRQQRPCTAMVNHKNINPENIPPWF